jgi:hypothetical protein
MKAIGMDECEVVSKLAEANIRILHRRRNEIDNGWRIDCAGGAVVNIYDTGSITVQGRDQAPVKRALGLSTGAPPAKRVRLRDRPVETDQQGLLMVARISTGSTHRAVFGAILDGAARNEVEEVLRRWGVELPDP